tara:strand:- start:216 stop:452 length:237 start_codon:yes stop_codon:yes gene_type:complete
MKNLTSPRYRSAIELWEFYLMIKWNLFKMSPGQWLIVNGKKEQYVTHNTTGIVLRSGTYRRVPSGSIFRTSKTFARCD